MVQLYEQANLKNIVVHDHISDENVDVWSSNGAISEERKEAIEICIAMVVQTLSLHSVQSEEAQYLLIKCVCNRGWKK